MSKSENIVQYTTDEIDEMIRRGESQTNWERVLSLTPEEIEASIDWEDEGPYESYGPAFKGLPEGFGIPEPKQQLTLRVDREVVDWFKAQGRGYQTRMNAVLRRYVDTHKG